MHKKNTKSDPPEIGPNNPTGKLDTARAALSAEKKRKTRTDDFIDKAVNWLKGQDYSDDPVEVGVGFILKEAYGMARADAAAILGFSKQVKLDGRCEIFNHAQTGAMMIRLAREAPAAEAQATDEPAQQAEPLPFSGTEKGKTLGEHVADAQGRQTRLPFPHGIGTWVNFMVNVGEIGQTMMVKALPARILNIHTNGNVSVYDLKIDGGKTFKEVPAFDIEQLPAEDEARIRNAESLSKLQKFVKVGESLAQMLSKEEAEEVRQSGELKATRKRIENLREKIDAHLCGVPVDGQQEIDLEDEGTGSLASPGQQPVDTQTPPIPADNSTAQDRLLGRITSKDTLEITGDNLPVDKLLAATIKGTDSSGKPPKIVPLEIPQAPGAWVCIDTQDGIAILLKALTRKEWADGFEATFGAPRAVPNEAQSVNQSAGGPFTGSPVKVGRTTLYLSPLDDALLLRLPATAATR